MVAGPPPRATPVLIPDAGRPTDGVRIELGVTGDVRSIRHGADVLVNQYLPGLHDSPAGGLFLRRTSSDGHVDAVALTGSRSPSQVGRVGVAGQVLVWTGAALGAAWTVSLHVATDRPVWVWRVDLVPDGAASEDLFAVAYAQDLALSPEGTARTSEPYVSQYLVHRALHDDRLGTVLVTRQTMTMAPALPLAVTAIAEGAVGHLTDGFQFWGRAVRAGAPAAALSRPDWPDRVLQYELALPSVLSAAAPLDAPRTVHCVSGYEPDRRGPLTNTLDWVRGVVEHAVRLAAREAVAREGVAREAVARERVAREAVREDVALQADTLQAVALQTTGRRAGGPAVAVRPPVRSLLAAAPLLTGHDLADEELVRLGAGSPRFVEQDDDGRLLSFFDADGAYVLRGAKEVLVERPHGHVLVAGGALDPTDDVLSTTVWAGGVFAAHTVLGNTSHNRLVSVHRHHLDLLRSDGLRVVVRAPGTARWQLLGVPSALVIDLGGVHWVYLTEHGRIDVRTTAASSENRVVVDVAGERPLDLLATVDVDLGEGDFAAQAVLDGHGLLFRPGAHTLTADRYPGLGYVLASPEATFGDDAALFADGLARDARIVTAAVTAGTRLQLVVTGDLADPARAVAAARGGLAQVPVAGPDRGAAGAGGASGGASGRASGRAAPGAGGQACVIDHTAELAGHRRTLARLTRGLRIAPTSRLAELELLAPWYAHDALVHLLVPHGLEQYSGAAWGVRDVCQGPMELMLAAGRFATARQILLRVLARQLDDGSFPQWFMFDAYADEYPDSAHGDVVVWPLFGLLQYVEASGDVAVLDESVPTWDSERRAARADGEPARRHVERLLDHLEAHRVPGTGLPAYGEGDWDDTLQPARAQLRDRMVSSWTTALTYQAMRLGERLLAGTRHADLADRMGAHAQALRAGAQRLLMPDGVTAGYVVVEADGSATPVIHPRDERTGITYRLIPMTRGIISGLFTPEQAARHERLVEDHLHFPDGVRLMDRPARFADGEVEWFLRAEQAAAVGREVGLMYTHAHIRYVEALTRLGRARVGDELLRISPIGLRDRLPTALPRQRSCYHSSSDADFPDRYSFAAGIDDLRAGRVRTRGGWRVYSSGPGIYLRQLFQGLLGLTERHDGLVVDPSLAPEDDGLEVSLELFGRRRTVRYTVRPGAGPVTVRVDGRTVDGTRLDNPYRSGGLLVPAAAMASAETVEVQVSPGS